MSATLQFKRNSIKRELLAGELQVNTETNTVYTSNSEIELSSTRNNIDLYSSNRVLTVKDDVITDLSSNPIREIGVNVKHWLNDTIINNTVDNDMYRISAYGFKYVRTMMPFDTADMMRSSYDTLGATEFWSRITKFLDHAQDNEIGVWLVIASGADTALDYWNGTSYNDYTNPNSTVMTKFADYARELITNIGNHPALAGYDIGLEWNSTSTTGATSAQLQSAIDTIAQVITTNDPHGRPVRAGTGETTGSYSNWSSVASTVINYDHSCNVVGKHVYPSWNLSNASTNDLRDELVKYRRLASDVNKPFIVGETGIDLSGHQGYGSTGTYSWAYMDHLMQAYVASGVQLTFISDFARTDDTTGFGVHPDNTANGSDVWFNKVVDAQSRISSEGYVDPYAVELSKFTAMSNGSVNFNNTGTLRYSNAKLYHGDGSFWGFTVSFWLKATGYDTTNTGNVIFDSITSSSTKKGFRIEIDPVLKRLQVVLLSEAGTATIHSGSSLNNTGDEWNHYTVQVGKQHGLLMFMNGKCIHQATVTEADWPGAATTKMVLGGNNLNTNGFIGELSQLNVIRRELTAGEIYDLYVYSRIPQGARRHEWDFQTQYDSQYVSDDGNNYSSLVAEVVNSQPSLTSNFIVPDSVVR